MIFSLAAVQERQHIRVLGRMVRQGCEDMRVLVDLGEKLLHQERITEALTVLEEAARKGGAGARGDWLLGAVLVEEGRFAEGRKKLEEAVERNPAIGHGEPYLYLLKEAFATSDARSPRVLPLVHSLDRYGSIAVKTRAGRLCIANGRRELAVQLLRDAIERYSYMPRRLRRENRHWAFRAKYSLFFIR